MNPMERHQLINMWCTLVLTVVSLVIAFAALRTSARLQMEANELSQLQFQLSQNEKNKERLLQVVDFFAIKDLTPAGKEEPQDCCCCRCRPAK